MRKKDVIIGVGVLVVFSILFIVALKLFAARDDTPTVSLGSSGAKVGIVEVTGVITDARKTVDWIDQLRKNKSVKAVVIRVDSPGGAVGPSQEMFEAVKKLRKAGKRVVISMGSVAASGGYYLSMGGDTIMANAGTLTGSIGVIMQMPVVKKLADKIGIGMETIKSGKMKDVGNMFREMTPEERAYLQSAIDDTYEQFVEAVAEGRHMTVEQVKVLADGRVYTGRQAKMNGLVDLLGTYDDAIRLAAKLGGISGEPKLVKPKPKLKGLLALMLGDDEESADAKSSLLNRILPGSVSSLTPSFEYRWIVE